ncbi:MAG: TonB family protein [Paludibacter sp.]|nr:TonB family protein [Paludibacter sp.]MDD4427742.1 TonB family protein [Paludibacter sp.]
MKQLALLSFLFFSLSIFSQETETDMDLLSDTTWLNASRKKIQNKDSAVYFAILSKENPESQKVVSKTYYVSGQIQEVISYSSLKPKIIDGKHQMYAENGQLLYDVDYKDGKRHGQFLTFWKNGILKRIDNYKDGEFINGTCFDIDGKEIEHFPYLIEPKYKYGKEALRRYLLKNTFYPPELSNIVGGRVFVSFVVDAEGNVVDVKLLKTSLIDAFDEEALRVVRNIPKGSFIPGKRDGENVRYRYKMPINFKPSFLKENNK